MRYIALAADYDETLADEGRVSDATVAALERFRASGRRLILVTGRELEDVQSVFQRLDLFDAVVGENGGVLQLANAGTLEVLGPPPDERFLNSLAARGVEPLHVGHVVVATREPHDRDVLEAIREQGLELQVIFNKGAVMVLPSGCNKATGLAAALHALGLSPHNVVAIGDGENDHTFLSGCEAGVAMGNAVPALQEQADFVTAGGEGAGVIELIDRLLHDDLASLDLARHRVLLGTDLDGSPVTVEPYGQRVLVSGTSGSGKSTLTMGLLERVAGAGYEFCLVDPEGDYSPFGEATVLGSKEYPPTLEDITQHLARPRNSVIVNLLAVPLADRPTYLERLVHSVHEQQSQAARPHWLAIDEAHHMLQPEAPEAERFDQHWGVTLLVTPHAQLLAREVLLGVDVLIAVGTEIPSTVRALAEALGVPPPADVPESVADGDAIVWRPRDAEFGARLVRMQRSELDRRRHERKYAEGELGEVRSFYFRGPAGALNLRAQNLLIFLQIADGLDEATWLYHLERGDYARWFRDVIKDEDLAREAKRVQVEGSASSVEERRGAIRAAVEARYTLPATSPTGSSATSP